MRRILIANRGEIAVRIIRSVHKQGMEAIALYHADEADALHIRLANEAYSLGSGSVSDTFLSIDKIIGIALEKSCDAIHPGYGFLSENYLLAAACEKNNITFIGPKSEVIRLMGSKSESKKIAKTAGVPTLEPLVFTLETNLNSLPYPLLVKASAGGGGKGMKVISSPEKFEEAIKAAKREAMSYFGDDELILEPYLENARHIEVQIIGDNFGNITHLFERECSLQRNHQKILEEAPAASITPELRTKLCGAAVRFASVLNYTNVGTVEFLVQGDQFYFMEMNTRIQVEHPVTEAITGVDLITAQIQISCGEALSNEIRNAEIKGHAAEVRIYAENPYNGFIPATGIINAMHLPKDVRFDSFIYEGCKVTPHFDAMLGKLIVHGNSRNEVISKLDIAIEQTAILGLNTNTHYLRQIVRDTNFRQNTISTNYLTQNQEKYRQSYSLEHTNTSDEIPVTAFVFSHFVKKRESLKTLWHISGPNFVGNEIAVFCNGNKHMVKILGITATSMNLVIDGEKHFFESQNISTSGTLSFFFDSHKYDLFCAETEKSYDFYQLNNLVFQLSSPLILRMAADFLKKTDENISKKFNQIVSPLFGKIIDVRVKALDKVKKGDILMTIESMKTENHILSPGDGIVRAVLVEKGLQVSENRELLTMNPVSE